MPLTLTVEDATGTKETLDVQATARSLSGMPMHHKDKHGNDAMHDHGAMH